MTATAWRFGICLVAMGAAGIAHARRPAPAVSQLPRGTETAAFGRHPQSTATTEAGLRYRIRALPVPARFRASALRALDKALVLQPGPADRSDAVLEPNRAWVSAHGSSRAGQYVGQHVGVSAVDGKRSTLMMSTSVTYRDGRVRDLWREVTPVGQGYHLETVSYAPGHVDGIAISYSGNRPSKNFLVDDRGHRVKSVTWDQAVKLKYDGIAARGNRLDIPGIR